MNTKLVRLNSGEDVICDLIEDTDDSITMGSAIVAVPQDRDNLDLHLGPHLQKKM